jgi:hypothetical protein
MHPTTPAAPYAAGPSASAGSPTPTVTRIHTPTATPSIHRVSQSRPARGESNSGGRRRTAPREGGAAANCDRGWSTGHRRRGDSDAPRSCFAAWWATVPTVVPACLRPRADTYGSSGDLSWSAAAARSYALARSEPLPAHRRRLHRTTAIDVRRLPRGSTGPASRLSVRATSLGALLSPAKEQELRGARIDLPGVARCGPSASHGGSHGSRRTTKPPTGSGAPEYRHGDSNPGFRRERAAS